MCIIDHYPLGNQRTEISGGLNISEKLGRDSRCLNSAFLIMGRMHKLPNCSNDRAIASTMEQLLYR